MIFFQFFLLENYFPNSLKIQELISYRTLRTLDLPTNSRLPTFRRTLAQLASSHRCRSCPSPISSARIVSPMAANTKDGDDKKDWPDKNEAAFLQMLHERTVNHNVFKSAKRTKALSVSSAKVGKIKRKRGL